MNYTGEEVKKTSSPCNYFVGNKCAAPARGFELNISAAELKKPVMNGTLNMTALSDYLPEETYSGYSITCTRKN